MNHFSTPNRIRFEFPPVDHLPALDAFLVDARAKDYPGKKGGKYQFKDRDKALAKAEEIAVLVASMQTVTPHLPDATMEKLRVKGICAWENLNLILAAHENGICAATALRQLIHAKKTSSEPKTLQEAFFLFVEAKKMQQVRKRTFDSLIPEIEKLIAALGAHTLLTSITLANVTDYLGNNSPTPGTFETKHRRITTFLNFCKNSKWLTENPASKVSLPKVVRKIEVTEPIHINRLLEATYTLKSSRASSDLRAYLTICAFTGVRPEEATELTWADVYFEQSFIYVNAEVSKVGEDRNVPLSPQAIAWLQTCPYQNGRIQPDSSLATRFRTVREKAGVKTWRKPGVPWPHDVLRHTYASSWLAVHKNRPELAEIMGTSTDIIGDHYRKPLPLATAEALFAILPPAHITTS